MEISNSGYDVIRTANLRRSGVATIQPSKSLVRCLPCSDYGCLKFCPASRGMVSESKIVIGMGEALRTIMAIAASAFQMARNSASVLCR
jgi:hypothetical protein